MKSKPLPVLLVLLLMLSNLPLAFGQQTTSGSWATVQQLKTDSKLVVKRKSGGDVTGSMIEATDSTLTIDRHGKPFLIQRTDIREIYVVRGKAQKGKWAAIGAVIGAGAGAGIGAIQYSPDRDDSEIYPKVGLLLGVGIGAVSGLAFGSTRRDRELVYSAI